MNPFVFHNFLFNSLSKKKALFGMPLFLVMIFGVQEIKGQTSFYSQDFEITNDWTLLPSTFSNANNYWAYGTGTALATTGSATHSGTGALQIWEKNSSSSTGWYNSYTNSTTSGYTRIASKTFDFSSIPCGSTVTFKYWVLCNGETGYDDLTVSVNSIVKQVPLTGITAWQQKTIDLSTFVGNSSVTVSFNWRNDGSVNNEPGARIDDIEITYIPLITVTPTTATICPNTIQALTAAPFINETFSGLTLPANWTTTVGSGDTVTISQTNNAGGTANEVKFTGNSQTTNIIDRIIYGPFNTTGQTSLSLSWKNYLSHYSSSYNYYVKVQTSTDGITWHDSGWGTNPVTATMNPSTISTTLATADIGSSTTYISFTMGGLTFGAFYWYIDDVTLKGSVFPTWTPITYLYSNSGATSSYILNTQAATVYIKSPTPGIYPYTATINGCTATSTITVNATNTAAAASNTPTLCVNTALTNITHVTTGATGISNSGVSGANGLPAGVSASWASNTITISGAPTTASGSPFNYSIPLTGGCGSVNATGTITVNSIPATPGTITGGVSQCPNTTSLQYSIAAVAGATSYTWTVPAGWSITAGQGTTAITVTSGSSNQNGNITVTATNSCSTSSASSLAVTVVSSLTYGAIPSTVNHVVISQIYGGGGNIGAIYTNDFVELFNPTNAPVSLNGYSLQYAATGGVNWDKVNLLGTIVSGGYFLIQLASQPTPVGAALPTPDLSSTSINMANDSGKIALINNQNTITTGLSCPPLASAIDFVGYGTANCSEGSSPAPALTSAFADFRNGLGGQDTDVNSIDFTKATPNPRNSSTLPQANQSFCVSGTPNLMVVNGASGSGSFLYQWYSQLGIVASPSGASTTGWTSLGATNGANTTIYTPSSAITASTTYACFVTPSGTPTCGSGAWASGVRQIVVNNIDWANLQSPQSGSMCANGIYNAYGQIYVDGLTNPAGAGAGIVAELGYSTSNTNPNTWTNWIATSFNTQAGNNDEYMTTLSGLLAGTYYYAFRYSLNGCPYKYGGINGIWNNDSGVLTVIAVPTTAAAGLDQTVCEGTTITLAANSPTVGSGQWSIISGAGGSITTISSSTSTFTGAINTTYTLRWTISNGICTSSDDVVIRINGINWVNTQWPPNASICPNGSLMVYGQIYVAGLTEPAGAGAGIVAQLGYSSTNVNPSTWTNWINASFNTIASNPGNNDEYMATLSGLSAGTYYYAYRYLLNGCSYRYGGYKIGSNTNGFWDGINNVSGVLTVNQVPNVTLSGLTTICNGSSTTLTANGANTYLWSNGLGTSNSITVSPINSTTYTVTGTDSNNCTNTATINVTVNPNPITTPIYHE